MRALIIATIVMGVMIIVGTAVLVYEIMARAGGESLATTPAAQSTNIAESGVFMPLERTERVTDIYPTGNFLSLHIKGSGSHERIIVLNPVTSKVISEIVIKE